VQQPTFAKNNVHLGGQGIEGNRKHFRGFTTNIGRVTNEAGGGGVIFNGKSKSLTVIDLCWW